MSTRVGFSFCVILSLAAQTYAQEFYPLAIGNRWDYREDYDDGFGPYSHIDTFSVIVIDTLRLPNGNLFYKLNGIDISWGQYVRVDSGKVYYWTPDDSSHDVLMYKLKAAVGETWQALPMYSSIRLEAIDTVVLFGETTRLLRFERDGLIMSTVTLSDKFGPVYFESPGEPPGTSWTDTDILGCTVSDTTYGLLVTVASGLKLPESFSLFQSYPNPSNAQITIPFDLAVSGSIALEIFNSLGQLVSSIQRQNLSPGRRSISWESTGFPSGVYYYRLSQLGSTETKRAIIVK